MRVILLNVFWISTLIFCTSCTLEANIAGRTLPSLIVKDNISSKMPRFEKKVCSNGPIFSQAKLTTGESIFAGDFSRLGPCSSPFLKYNTMTGLSEAFGPLDAAIGEAHVAISDGAGGYFIGGKFETKDKLLSLMHILADGRVSTWNSQLTNGHDFPTVSALTVSDGILYVGGQFTGAGGESRVSLAAFNVVTGQLTEWGPPISPDGDGSTLISSLEATVDSVFVGGAFGTIGTNAHISSGVAKVSKVDNSADIGFTAVGLSSYVSKLKVHNGNLLLVDGGRTKILNPTTGADTGILSSFAVVPVWASLAEYQIYEDELWIAGMFDSVGGHASSNLVKFNFSGATPVLDTSWSTTYEPMGWVSRFVVTENHILTFTNGVVGYFDKSNGNQYVPPALSPVSDAIFIAAAVEGDMVLMLHGSRTLGLPEKKYLAMYSAQGELLPWNPNPTDFVKSVIVHEDRIFVGGRFNDIGSTPSGKRYLVELDMDGEVTSWDAGADGEVTEMMSVDGSLLVSGEFSNIGSGGSAFFSKLSFSDASALPWNLTVSGRVLGFDVVGSDVLFGGGFSEVNSQPIQNLAKVDLHTGELLGDTPAVNSWVNGVKVVENDVYLFGQFTEVGGVPRSRLAAYRLSDGGVTSWAPNIVVYAHRTLRKVADKIIVFAHFNTHNGIGYTAGSLTLDRATGEKIEDPRNIYHSTVWLEE